MAEGIVQLPADRGISTGANRKAYMREYNRNYRAKHSERLIAAAREWKRNNRERSRELNAQSAARRKAECFALFGSKCQRCGFTDDRALQIDHINGAGSEDRRANYRAGKPLYAAILRGDKDQSEFQLLCANCNWIKRFENEECKRG